MDEAPPQSHAFTLTRERPLAKRSLWVSEYRKRHRWHVPVDPNRSHPPSLARVGGSFVGVEIDKWEQQDREEQSRPRSHESSYDQMVQSHEGGRHPAGMGALP